MSGRVPDVVCTSVNHWTGLPSTMQHLMTLVSRTARVLFIDPPIDVFSTLGRPRRWAKLRGLRQVGDRLWVLSPVALSHPSGPEARLTYHRAYARRARRAMSSLGFASPVLWTFAPEHVGYAGALGESLLVYHAADEPSSTSGGDPVATSAMERDLVEASDLVFVVSQALLAAHANSGKARRLPNAANRAHFARVLAGDAEATPDRFAAAVASPSAIPPEFARLPGPVVMFAGAAYGWFDEELFLGVARERPDWNLVVVGPPGRALRTADLPDNVTLLGRKPYAEFPRFVAGCDAAVHPLRAGSFATHCDPIILYEFLLCGKPVVATPFPAALERGDLVRTADTVSGFVAAIDSALREAPDAPARNERVRFGYANTWDDRAAEAVDLMERALDAKGTGDEPDGGGDARP